MTYLDFIDLKENKKILSKFLDKIYNNRPRILWRPVLWLKGNRIVVERKIMNSVYRNISICDFENNRVLKVISNGVIVGVNSDRSKLVIYSNGKFTAVDVP